MTRKPVVPHLEGMKKYGVWPNPASIGRYCRKIEKARKALQELGKEDCSSCDRDHAIFQGMADTLQCLQTMYWDRWEHDPIRHAIAKMRADSAIPKEGGGADRG